MSSWKFDERAYPQWRFHRNRPDGEQDDELMAREMYEQQQQEEQTHDAAG